MGRRGGRRASKHSTARSKSTPHHVAVKQSKRNLPPPPPPIEEQIVTPPEISTAQNPTDRMNQIMRIPNFTSYDEEDEDESPTFAEDAHPQDCRCNCCREDF